jgi:hypothetical protein
MKKPMGRSEQDRGIEQLNDKVNICETLERKPTRLREKASRNGRNRS